MLLNETLLNEVNSAGGVQKFERMNENTIDRIKMDYLWNLLRRSERIDA